MVKNERFCEPGEIPAFQHPTNLKEKSCLTNNCKAVRYMNLKKK
jgi:hypothetical protein